MYSSEPVLLPNVCLINLANNRIGGVHSPTRLLWNKFPSAWWVDLCSNNISQFEQEGFPLALGYLNVRNNDQLNTMDKLRFCNSLVLRLNAPITSTDSSMIWVLNDDFILSNRMKNTSRRLSIAKSRSSRDVNDTAPVWYKHNHDVQVVVSGSKSRSRSSAEDSASISSVWNAVHPNKRAINMLAVMQV